MTSRCASTAESLNRDCHCTTTDLPALRSSIDGARQTASPIVETHPHLFSDSPVFLERAHFEQMQRFVAAMEQVASHAGYQRAVLGDAAAISNVVPANPGVFYGYDFHIAADGPRLIEINTNAGGAFLNIAARDAQIACCEAASSELARLPGRRQLEDEIVSMFRREWRLARGDAALRTIAIVDEHPASQFLYPEFQLAKALFESRGIRTRIVDLHELKLEGGRLTVAGEVVDLVYNRSTDFGLASPVSQALRDAYERDIAVVTPHPRGHALYANKRNLALLSDLASLTRMGIDAEAASHIAQVIPRTRQVDGAVEDWWRDRKSWFFKPTRGFGSRGAYRGDKLTRRVIAEVLKQDYVAQEFVPPGERNRGEAGGGGTFKVDIRCYAYAGRIQLTVARLYQGQTTNFRSAGGGFAAVYLVDSREQAA
jgi:hypothetical protein